jgi:hypothetical protein
VDERDLARLVDVLGRLVDVLVDAPVLVERIWAVPSLSRSEISIAVTGTGASTSTIHEPAEHVDARARPRIGRARG